jgi:hypothetical protein
MAVAVPGEQVDGLVASAEQDVGHARSFLVSGLWGVKFGRMTRKVTARSDLTR